MTTSPTRRIAALALGLAATGLVVWLVLVRRAAAQRAEVEAQRARIDAALLAHARADPAPRATMQADSAAGARAPELRRYYLDPQDAAILFPRDAAIETYDPWTYFRHKPS